MQRLPILVTLLLVGSMLPYSEQGIPDNEVDTDKFNAFAEVAGSLLGGAAGGAGGDVGNMLTSFMASEGGRQLGDLLMSGQGANMLQGLGSMLSGGGNGDHGHGSHGGGGMDLDMLANVVSAFSGSDGGKDSGEGFDLSNAVNLAKSFMSQDGSKDFMAYLPTLMSIFSAVMGPDAERTAKEHEGHSWMLPPVIERLHILADQLMNSDLGRDMVKKIGAEKFVRIFSDDTGNFSYRKFVDMLENHSFRKHWIQMVTGRIAEVLSYFADPYTQKKTIATIQFFMNNFLKSYGVPKHALFDPTRPAESITALANYLPKRYLGFKFNSAPYVVPAVAYVQNLLVLAENKGILGRKWSSNELTDKLTDTLNLEMIEPLARVNRAIRFAKKTPHCTRYVLCIANQHEPAEQLSLPGLKKSLASAATFGASWLLSEYDRSPFWTLYGMVNEGKNCEGFWNEECHNFHIEEEKVTTEYVHSEL